LAGLSGIAGLLGIAGAFDWLLSIDSLATGSFDADTFGVVLLSDGLLSLPFFWERGAVLDGASSSFHWAKTDCLGDSSPPSAMLKTSNFFEFLEKNRSNILRESFWLVQRF
jgi:hypothetical protein